MKKIWAVAVTAYRGKLIWTQAYSLVGEAHETKQQIEGVIFGFHRTNNPGDQVIGVSAAEVTDTQLRQVMP